MKFAFENPLSQADSRALTKIALDTGRSFPATKQRALDGQLSTSEEVEILRYRVAASDATVERMRVETEQLHRYTEQTAESQTLSAKLLPLGGDLWAGQEPEARTERARKIHERLRIERGRYAPFSDALFLADEERETELTRQAGPSGDWRGHRPAIEKNRAGTVDVQRIFGPTLEEFNDSQKISEQVSLAARKICEQDRASGKKMEYKTALNKVRGERGLALV